LLNALYLEGEKRDYEKGHPKAPNEQGDRVSAKTTEAHKKASSILVIGGVI